MDKNWHKHYEPGVPYTIDPDQYASFAHMLEKMFDKYSTKPCFMSFNTSLSYQQIDILSQRFAGYLQSQCGCVKGDRIAMLMLNTLQYPVAIFGALRAGLIVVGVSPLSSPTEVNRILKETEPTCVLVMANLAPTLESALAISHPSSVKQIIVSRIGDLLGFFKGPLINLIAKHKVKTPSWHLPKVINFKETIQAKYQKTFIKPLIEPQDLAFLSYTSGRDGPIPKCAMFTHRNMVSQILQVNAWLNPYWKTDRKGLFLCMMPFYHTSIVLVTLCITLRGLPTMLGINSLDTPDLIKEFKKNIYFATVSINSLIRALLQDENIKKVDFSNLTLTGGWGGFTGMDIVQWKGMTGNMIIEGYGSLEAPVSLINPILLDRFNAKIGLPLPSVEIKICDDDGNELPIDTPGNLWIRGPHVMKGYWRNPELTNAYLTYDGWFNTGDVMTLDHDGFLAFVDRRTDVIMTPSGPVYPSEIEVVIALIKSVQEVAIASQTIKSGEQIIKAFIVRKNNNLTINEVKTHCQKYLVDYQVPQEIEFRDTLPKTDMGDIRRQSLRDNHPSQENL
jgi:long-chain acyl-CoA synthetase